MQASMSRSGFDEIAVAAARLFLAHGFKGVSQRAIARELGIQAASLYHHCPGGKAELYVRSVGRFLDGYEERLLGSRGQAGFPESLLRMATFTLGENHVDLRRIVAEDLPNLPDDRHTELENRLHGALLRPFVQEFEAAKHSGRVRKRVDSSLAAACVLAVADNLGGLHLPNGAESSREELDEAKRLVRAGVSLLLNGARA